MRELNLFLKIISTLFLLLTIGCGNKNFSASDSFNREVVTEVEAKADLGKVPQDIAYGGIVQILPLSQSKRVGIESLIGQSILAKVHRKDGIRVEVGYPHLQGRFGF